MRTTKLLTAIGATLILATSACAKSDRKAADAAATKVVMGEHATQLRDMADFEVKSSARVASLDAKLQMMAVQPSVIEGLAEGATLSDVSRADLNARLDTFKMRVEDARSAVATLRVSAPATFGADDDAATKAVGRLDEASKAAWDALRKADRVEEPST
jgi:hypothetical protein